MAVALLVGLPVASSAQETGRLVGRVLNAQTGEPLASAQVFLADGTIGAPTALDGAM